MRATLLALLISAGCLLEPVYPGEHDMCLSAIWPTPVCEREYYWVAPHWGMYGTWHDGHYYHRPGYFPPRHYAPYRPYHPSPVVRDHAGR